MILNNGVIKKLHPFLHNLYFPSSTKQNVTRYPLKKKSSLGLLIARRLGPKGNEGLYLTGLTSWRCLLCHYHHFVSSYWGAYLSQGRCLLQLWKAPSMNVMLIFVGVVERQLMQLEVLLGLHCTSWNWSQGHWLMGIWNKHKSAYYRFLWILWTWAFQHLWRWCPPPVETWIEWIEHHSLQLTVTIQALQYQQVFRTAMHMALPPLISGIDERSHKRGPADLGCFAKHSVNHKRMSGT